MTPARCRGQNDRPQGRLAGRNKLQPLRRAGDSVHRRAGPGRIRILRVHQHLPGQESPDCLQEVTAAVHARAGLAGVHVCANTDWSLLLGSGWTSSISMPSAILTNSSCTAIQIRRLLSRAGGCLAWGLVPTALARAGRSRHPGRACSPIWQSKCERHGSIWASPPGTVLPAVVHHTQLRHGLADPELSRKVLALTRAFSPGREKLESTHPGRGPPGSLPRIFNRD
jgi:hypothetical protein